VVSKIEAQYSLSALLLLATVIDAINTSHSETMSPHGQVQAAVLAASWR